MAPLKGEVPVGGGVSLPPAHSNKGCEAMPSEKDYLFTGHNSQHTEAARRLRKDMTPQERHLWYDYLRNYPVKFYRQRPIDQFIVDFYCSKAHLVIELDGSQHYTVEGITYDQIRSEILNQYQLEVMRFSNVEIDRNFQGVCGEIDRKVKERMRG